MLKLKRLIIREFRRLAPNTELVFNDGFNVLLGQNGAGKTSLLELIVAVLRSDLSQYRAEAFELEWEIAFGDDMVNVWVKSQPRPTTHPIHHQPRPEAAHWQLRLHYLGSGIKWDYATSSDGSVETNAPGNQNRRFDIFDSGFVHSIIWHLTSRTADFRLLRDLYRVAREAFRFDESLGGYQELIGGDLQSSRTERLLYYVEQWMYSVTLCDWSYFPDQIIEKIGGDEQAVSWEPHFASDDWPFLGQIAAALGARTVRLGARLEETIPHDGFQISTYRGFNIQVTFHDGRTVSAPLLSFGQKRLLSFLYHVASNKHFIVADEIVNGLHWEWIETCLSAIGDRQAFLTSQNPLLLDALPIDSQEAAARTFIQCRSHLADHTTTWHWRNLSERDARDLWEAYSVGIQSIGDILRSRGLW